MSTSELERRLGDRAPTARGGRDERHEHGRAAREAAGRHRTEHAPPPPGLDRRRAGRGRRRGRADRLAAGSGLGQGRPRARGRRSSGRSRRRRRSSRPTPTSTRTGPPRTWPTTPTSPSGRTSWATTTGGAATAGWRRSAPRSCSTSATPCGARARRRTCPACSTCTGSAPTELGRGPYPDNTFSFTVKDDEIVDASMTLASRRTASHEEMWGPFARWVSRTYPEDAAVMYYEYPKMDWAARDASLARAVAAARRGLRRGEGSGVSP